MKFSEFKKSVDDSLISISPNPDDSSEKVKNLEVILDIVNSINRSLILDDVLELVLKNAINLTDSDRGFIVLKTQSGKLEFKLGLDAHGNILPESLFNVSNTVVKNVFEEGESRFIEGAQSDANNDPSKSILRLELQTILCSPLITDDKKIGVIYVDSKHLHKIKVREITDTFEILAGQAATAIRNAQLYHGQVNAYNALQEANTQLIRAERKALKSSIDAEIGQSLQGLVHIALLETESLLRTIEKAQKELEGEIKDKDSILFDRLKLKSKVASDSIRSIQKYAQVLMETSVMNMNKDSGDLNRTIHSVIKYISPMKRFHSINFKTDFKKLPLCNYDSEQIQHLLVHLFTNSAEAKKDATININSYSDDNKVYIEIVDDGPGFPVDKIKSFNDLLSLKSGSYGLYLCKSIIDQHNGAIDIFESPNGAAIRFSLPVTY
ncbi:MAG: GAF domain-containing sensor histidine kinase [Ignavibacteriales bacterium]|nr:MAG: GAF domain-containing sensor histidine kinase [Ignavibacteriales bacterium]